MLKYVFNLCIIDFELVLYLHQLPGLDEILTDNLNSNSFS